MVEDPLRFICDCMNAGAAKCLRAWGYYAHWKYGIADATVVNTALKDGLIVITGDAGIMARNLITSGRVKAVFIPVGLDKWGQFRVILEALAMPRRDPRCMECGGELADVAKEDYREELPPRTYEWLDEFWRCQACGKFFWKGTHWSEIEAQLNAISEADKAAGSSPSQM